MSIASVWGVCIMMGLSLSHETPPNPRGEVGDLTREYHYRIRHLPSLGAVFDLYHVRAEACDLIKFKSLLT